MKKRILISILFLLGCVPLLIAQKTISLTITDNTNPAGTKYYCYHRMAGGTYVSTDRKDLGTAKTYSWILSAPVALGTHLFACTAYILDGGATTMESPFSNDFTWANFPAAPTITGTVAAISRKEATLLAQTSIPMKTSLSYGPVKNSVERIVVVSATERTDHSVILTKLQPHTAYLYQWTATDPDGNVVTFSGNFATL